MLVLRSSSVAFKVEGMASIVTNEEPTLAALAESVALMARLRGPGGCPWDREQTFDSIKPYTLEETYEVFDAIERRAWPELRDELGDLLLQVLFYAQMAAEAGYFTLTDVAENLNAKLIRRHPHVFGEAEAADAHAVLRNWEQIKAKEKQATRASSWLEDVPRSMPATLEAAKLGSRAAKVGFDWPDAEGLFAKLDEEVRELRAELDAANAPGQEANSSALRRDSQLAPAQVEQSEQIEAERVQAEFGDVLFTMMNLARHLRLDAESALRGTNARFRRRFAAMEQMAGRAEQLSDLSPGELEELWSEAKRRERAAVGEGA